MPVKSKPRWMRVTTVVFFSQRIFPRVSVVNRGDLGVRSAMS